jgi:ribonuclease Z
MVAMLKSASWSQPDPLADYSVFPEHKRHMKLVLLGTGGYFPTSARQTACLMLPEVGIVLDAGTGMCRVAQHLQSNRLDIFLTHAHLDHVAGLTYLVNLLPRDVLNRVTVHGEPAKLAAVRDHLFAEAIFPVPPPFAFKPLSDTYPLQADGVLTHFPLQHPGGSIGYRLDWSDRSLAYVTDTTASPDANYIEQIRGVDLLLHEAYFSDDTAGLPHITGHSSLLAVAELAASAHVGRLVLVHLNPQSQGTSAYDLDTAQRIFPNTVFGVDGAEHEL